MNRRRIMMSRAGVAPVLPAEYQRVEWVGWGSGSNLYIDTGIINALDRNLTVEFEAYTSTNARGYVVGSGVGSGIDFYSGLGDSVYPTLFLKNTTALIPLSQSLISKRFKIAANINYPTYERSITVDVDGVSYTANGSGSFNRIVGNHIYLFQHAYNSSYGIFKGAIYYCKMYDGINLIFDAIPCYRKADGVIGFYDTVSQTFKTAGSGTLTKGADV